MNKIFTLWCNNYDMSADTQIKPLNSLRIHLDNKSPLELVDLTKSLLSLSNQFNSYIESTGNFSKEKDVKLYVQQVKSGSIIIDLVEFATVAMLPVLGNINVIAEFAEHLKSLYEYFKKGEGDKPQLTVNECKELIEIVNPAAKDKKSSMEFSIVNNGDNNIIPIFIIDSVTANAAQNILKEEIDSLKLISEGNIIHTAQLMTMFQVRGKDNDTGNKGVIEALSNKPLNVLFESEGLKKEMLHSEYNPVETAYSVDVIIQTINNKPAAYKVIKFHDAFSIE